LKPFDLDDLLVERLKTRSAVIVAAQDRISSARRERKVEGGLFSWFREKRSEGLSLIAFSG
jgi:hypothetical protein